MVTPEASLLSISCSLPGPGADETSVPDGRREGEYCKLSVVAGHVDVSGHSEAAACLRDVIMATTDAGHCAEVSFEFLNVEQVTWPSRSAIACEMNSRCGGSIVELGNNWRDVHRLGQVRVRISGRPPRGLT